MRTEGQIEPMRFALIGAGMVSDAHARSLRELSAAEPAVVYSPTEARARALADRGQTPGARNPSGMDGSDGI